MLTRESFDVCRHSVPAADNGTCSICLDDMDDDSVGTVILTCGHKFHSNCAMELFRRGDSRCPVCRHDPYNSTVDPAAPLPDLLFEDDSADDSADNYVPFHVALRDAMSNRNDKPTQRMKTTLRKWKSQYRDATKEMKEKTQSMARLREALNAKINKLWLAFKEKHKVKIGEADTATKNLSMANTQVRNSRLRLARKYGFRPVRRYSRYSRSRRR